MHKQNKTIQWKPKPNKTAQHTTKMSLHNTVERWKERRVTMQPKAGIATPQGNGIDNIDT